MPHCGNLAGRSDVGGAPRRPEWVLAAWVLAADGWRREASEAL